MSALQGFSGPPQPRGEILYVSTIFCLGGCGGCIQGYPARSEGEPEDPKVREAIEKIAKDFHWTLKDDGTGVCPKCTAKVAAL